MDRATYQGDARLAELLAAAGSRYDVERVIDLVQGVNAAPAGFEPHAWVELVAPNPGPELRAQLLALRAALGAESRRPEPPVAGRLARLRRELADLDLAGFVLPLTDEHGNEYLPASARRLSWLTGFTGSAGTVAVLRDRAALFVDGRYTLQAETEVDGALFERHQVPEHPPARWLGEHLPRGGRLGFDPLLHRKDDIERLRWACAKADGVLVALDANPVDRVWAARPPAPVAPVRTLDVAYAGESADDKRARMAAEVAKAGAEALVLTAPDSIAWLLNLRGGDIPYNPLALAFALLHAEGGGAVELFIDPRKLPEGLGNEVAVRPIGAFGLALDDLGRRGLAVLADPAQVSLGVVERLRAAGARVVEDGDPTVLAKACKNPVELDGARNAQRRDGAALARFLRWLEAEAVRRPVTEIEAAERLEAERAKDPLFRGPSFPTISGAGPNGAIVHYRVTPETDRRLEPGSLYLVDSGGQYLDGTTDVTRTVAVGTPSEEMRRRFTLVLKGHIAIARAVFPAGTTGAQLDTLARLHLWRAGLDFDHGTGHGVGSYLCVHEGPARLSKAGGGVALKPGMILSNEPGYYRAGAYGIRTENLLIVVGAPKPEGGERDLLAFETITRAPIDRRLIDACLLDAEERAWLDAYHARVRIDLTPLVDADTAVWLAEATAPLAAS